ncbi:MAG: hypothetical protein P4L84_29425 [Isosphaeraceae bacterium]|nr:hypothetical protein [Isosphaeraceae bacterium]
MSRTTTFQQRAGATFRALINDLKRNEAAAASELGVDESVVLGILAGERPVTRDIIEKAVAIWPVNERDFFPIHDDAPDGLRVMRKAESVASRRVFQRGGADFYEYRDTAMSRLVMIRPEWIKMLHVVTDNDPENPTVRWNNGHFLYQFTYFIGAVNYYYEWNGRKFCAPMATGDSVFGLPFAKHSFASRDPTSPGRILALTYGGRLSGDAQHELGALGEEAARQYVLPLNDAARAQSALLRLHAANGSYSTGQLAAASGVGRDRLERALDGEETLDTEALEALADALRVPVRELVPAALDTTDGVVIVPGERAPAWLLPGAGRPAYRVKELAGSRVTPYAKSLELEVLPDPVDRYCLTTGLHEYGYNHGPAPVTLGWECDGSAHRTVLEPEDSFYIKPHVPHWFTAPARSDPDAAPRVLLLRVGGKIAGDTALEASIIGRDAISRVAFETTCWYDRGRRAGPEDAATSPGRTGSSPERNASDGVPAPPRFPPVGNARLNEERPARAGPT